MIQQAQIVCLKFRRDKTKLRLHRALQYYSWTLPHRSTQGHTAHCTLTATDPSRPRTCLRDMRPSRRQCSTTPPRTSPHRSCASHRHPSCTGHSSLSAPTQCPRDSSWPQCRTAPGSRWWILPHRSTPRCTHPRTGRFAASRRCRIDRLHSWSTLTPQRRCRCLHHMAPCLQILQRKSTLRDM